MRSAIYRATETLVLKLYYDRNSYVVTIDPGNGEDASSQTVVYGTVLSQPEDPRMDDHNFVGWFEEDTGLPVKWEDGITRTVTIKGKFVEKGPEIAGYVIRYHYDDEVDEFDGSGEVGTLVPYDSGDNRTWKGKNYMLVTKPVEDKTISKNTAENTIDVYYTLDQIGKDGGTADGDGIPDNCQVTINFIAHYGTPANTQVVLPKLDENGQMSAGGNAVLSEEHIPSLAADAGCRGGQWDREPRPGMAEVAMIFFRLLKDNAREQYKTASNPFSDVPNDAWYATAATTLANMGIIKGRAPGVFAPYANITRAELAAITARFDMKEVTNMPFSDVPANFWAYKEITVSAANGWMIGDGVTTRFRPLDNITRAETITMINRFLHRDKATLETIGYSGKMITWPDNEDAGAWYYLAIQEATNSHDYTLIEGVGHWTDIKDTFIPDR